MERRELGDVCLGEGEGREGRKKGGERDEGRKGRRTKRVIVERRGEVGREGGREEEEVGGETHIHTTVNSMLAAKKILFTYHTDTSTPYNYRKVS